MVTAVDKKHTISMKNRTIILFTGNICQIFAYLLSTYRKISPINVNDFKIEVTDIYYEPATPVDNIFKNVGDLL